ncbi:helix-turn-helix domain-containing protein [Streptomyces sp. WM6386]|uniref:helix-turn-helix domain-containing protein n=1 Tax=Streptomyces sp. WM6386 TaxID=1415558 RepID=UPI002D21BC32|nr:helix-turn-helix domain-containing protein [Streptomyces sp. WM6386]
MEGVVAGDVGAGEPLAGGVEPHRGRAGQDADAVFRPDRVDFHRQLALTALTYLDNGRRLDQTAAALFTHPNTVRYRLGRLREITAGSLNEPLADGGSGPLHTLHWRWALTTWLEVSPRSA